VKDYQEIKVQEKLDLFTAGSVPQSILVLLEDDLVDCCKPGDDVTINGIVIYRFNKTQVDKRCELELVIHANFIKVNNDEQQQIHITKEQVMFIYLYSNLIKSIHIYKK
jgi:DNA helicase MCM9